MVFRILNEFSPSMQARAPTPSRMWSTDYLAEIQPDESPAQGQSRSLQADRDRPTAKHRTTKTRGAPARRPPTESSQCWKRLSTVPSTPIGCHRIWPGARSNHSSASTRPWCAISLPLRRAGWSRLRAGAGCPENARGRPATTWRRIQRPERSRLMPFRNAGRMTLSTTSRGLESVLVLDLRPNLSIAPFKKWPALKWGQSVGP